MNDECKNGAFWGTDERSVRKVRGSSSSVVTDGIKGQHFEKKCKKIMTALIFIKNVNKIILMSVVSSIF